MVNRAKGLKPAQLQIDEDSLAALKTISHYFPVNSAYTLEALMRSQANLMAARHAAAQAQAAAAAAHDNLIAHEWEFHHLILGMRDQVCAQFGRDSNEAAAVGWGGRRFQPGRSKAIAKKSVTKQSVVKKPSVKIGRSRR